MIPDAADRSGGGGGAPRPLAEPARSREQRRLETSPAYPARKALHRYRMGSNSKTPRYVHTDMQEKVKA